MVVLGREADLIMHGETCPQSEPCTPTTMVVDKSKNRKGDKTQGAAMNAAVVLGRTGLELQWKSTLKQHCVMLLKAALLLTLTQMANSWSTTTQT